MSNTKRKKITPRTITIIIVFLILFGIIGFFLCQKLIKPEEPSNNNIQDASGQVIKTQESPEKTLEAKDDSGGKTPEKYEGEDPNKSPELSGSISSARVLGDNLVIRVNVDQFLSEGSCSLKLTSGEKVFTENRNIEAMVSTSTCDGFEIPVSKLSSGTWDIEIVLSSGQKTGIVTGKVEI